MSAAAVVGGEARSPRYYSSPARVSPSPSPSPDGAPSVSFARTDTAKNASRPSPNVDIQDPPLPTPDKPDTIECEVASIIDKIRGLNSLDPYFGLELEDVSPDVWAVLSKKLSDERELKLEYRSDWKILTVTGPPTNVHEGYKWAIQSLIRATAHDNQFTFETNAAIQFREGPHNGDSIIPDFAWGKHTSDGNGCAIILESGYSQSARDLDQVAAMHMTRPEVGCVVCIKFVTTAFAYPTSRPTPGSVPAQLEAFQDALVPPLGPVEYEDHTWAPAITAIKATVYLKKVGAVDGGSRDELTITPTEGDDETRLSGQKSILKALRKVTRLVMGDSAYHSVYGEGKHRFNIDWAAFYDDIPRRLVQDAYLRYWKWFYKDSPKPQYSRGPRVDVSTVKRTRDLYGYDSEDSDAPSELDASPTKKKPKPLSASSEVEDDVKEESVK